MSSKVQQRTQPGNVELSDGIQGRFRQSEPGGDRHVDQLLKGIKNVFTLYVRYGERVQNWGADVEDSFVLQPVSMHYSVLLPPRRLFSRPALRGAYVLYRFMERRRRKWGGGKLGSGVERERGRAQNARARVCLARQAEY